MKKESPKETKKENPRYTVIKEFRDKENFAIVHEVGKDVSDLDPARIETLISGGYVKDNEAKSDKK